MKVLIACEVSGVVRDAFRARGHDAWSCDIKPSPSPFHRHGDVLPLLGESWDLVIAHPPCTYLTVTGNKWFKPEYHDRFPTRIHDREEAAAFFLAFTRLSCRWAIENPVGTMSSRFRPADQLIQPYEFGDAASKLTCLWLHRLPPLVPTAKIGADAGPRVVFKSGKSMPSWYAKAPKADRAAIRSKTFPGIANAMADQWGTL